MSPSAKQLCFENYGLRTLQIKEFRRNSVKLILKQVKLKSVLKLSENASQKF
jgi:hypothetical protein